MRRYRLGILLFGTIVLLSACSRQALLVLTDQYWKASELESKRFTKAISHVREKTGVNTSVVTVPYSPAARVKLVETLTRSSARLVLLSPLYSNDGVTLATRFPHKRIAVFAPQASNRTKITNLIDLISDPAPGFRSAAARISRDLAKPGDSNGSAPLQIAGVFSDDEQGQAALTGFQSGLDSLAAAPALTTLRVGGSSDRSRLRRFLQDSKAKGASLYLLAAPALNAYAFEVLKNDTTPIVTENWDYGATYSGKVLFSLDEDIASAILKIVETMGRPADNQIRVPWGIVVAASQSR